MQPRFHSLKVGEVDVFYREAGPADAPALETHACEIGALMRAFLQRNGL